MFGWWLLLVAPFVVLASVALGAALMLAVAWLWEWLDRWVDR